MGHFKLYFMLLIVVGLRHVQFGSITSPLSVTLPFSSSTRQYIVQAFPHLLILSYLSFLSFVASFKSRDHKKGVEKESVPLSQGMGLRRRGTRYTWFINQRIHSQ
jgi:hypothetical protein